jgi:hypothetical protein
MSNLYRGPSIDASYQVSIHLAKQFQRQIKNAFTSRTWTTFATKSENVSKCRDPVSCLVICRFQPIGVEIIKIDGNKKKTNSRERFLFVNLNMKINGYMVTSNKQSPIITDTVKPTLAGICK